MPLYVLFHIQGHCHFSTGDSCKAGQPPWREAACTRASLFSVKALTIPVGATTTLLVRSATLPTPRSHATALKHGKNFATLRELQARKLFRYILAREKPRIVHLHDIVLRSSGFALLGFRSAPLARELASEPPYCLSETACSASVETTPQAVVCKHC